MSSISIATLPRMSREALSGLLLSTDAANTVAIVDVRDTGTCNPYMPVKFQGVRRERGGRVAKQS